MRRKERKEKQDKGKMEQMLNSKHPSSQERGGVRVECEGRTEAYCRVPACLTGVVEAYFSPCFGLNPANGSYNIH